MYSFMDRGLAAVEIFQKFFLRKSARTTTSEETRKSLSFKNKTLCRHTHSAHTPYHHPSSSLHKRGSREPFDSSEIASYKTKHTFWGRKQCQQLISWEGKRRTFSLPTLGRACEVSLAWEQPRMPECRT